MNDISDGLRFFKKQLSRQHLLGNIFKLCSKRGYAVPPPVQFWDACVLCGHNGSLAWRLLFCRVRKNSAQVVTFSEASVLTQCCSARKLIVNLAVEI